MPAQIGDYKRAVIETSLAQEASRLKLIYLLLIIILVWSELQGKYQATFFKITSTVLALLLDLSTYVYVVLIVANY